MPCQRPGRSCSNSWSTKFSVTIAATQSANDRCLALLLRSSRGFRSAVFGVRACEHPKPRPSRTALVTTKWGSRDMEWWGWGRHSQPPKVNLGRLGCLRLDGAEAEKRNNETYILVVDRASWPSGLTESGVCGYRVSVDGMQVGSGQNVPTTGSQNAGAETAIICTCRQLRACSLLSFLAPKGLKGTRR